MLSRFLHLSIHSHIDYTQSLFATSPLANIYVGTTYVVYINLSTKVKLLSCLIAHRTNCNFIYQLSGKYIRQLTKCLNSTMVLKQLLVVSHNLQISTFLFIKVFKINSMFYVVVYYCYILSHILQCAVFYCELPQDTSLITC